MTRRSHNVPGQSLFERCFGRCADPRWDRHMSMMDRFGFAPDNGLGSLARWLRFVYLTLPEDEEEIEEEIAIQRVRRIGRRARVQRPARSARVTSKLLEMVAYEWMGEDNEEASEPASVTPLRRARPRQEGAPFRRSTRQKILNRAERQWSERIVPGQRLAERQSPTKQRVRRSSHMAWAQSNLVFAHQGPQHVEIPEEYEQFRHFGMGSSRVVSRVEKKVRPIERALRQVGRTQGSPAFAVLQDLATVSKGAQRRDMERLLEYSQSLDPDTQEKTIRRQLSRLQGPLVGSARAELVSPSRQDKRPIGRAASRMLPLGNPKRRFGPVLSSSPSFVVLSHEPDEVAPIEKIAGGRVAPLRSSEQLRATGAYEKPVQARVLRQARSQESAGRAGPLPLVADATFEKGSARPIRRRRPTEWVSQLSVDSVQNTILPGSRKGFDAIRPVPSVPSATDHVVRRAEVRPVFGVGRIRPASISEASREILRSSIRRFTEEGSSTGGTAIARAGSRGFRPRLSRAAISGIPTAYVTFTPSQTSTDELPSWSPRKAIQRFSGRSLDPQQVSPSLGRPAFSSEPSNVRLAERIDARRLEPGTAPSMMRVARQKQVSRERQSRMRIAAPDFATLATVRPDQAEDVAYSEPSVRAFNRGRIPSIERRTTLFEAPMAHAAAMHDSPIVQRTAGDSLATRPQPARRFTGPTVRAAQRGRAAAPLSRRSGLWRMSVPMKHIEADVSPVLRSEESLSTPMNRAALRAVSVPAYDSRGGRRASPNVTGHVYSAQRVRTLQPSLGGSDGPESRQGIGQKTIARIPERATAGTTVSSQFRGGLRAVPTAYLQADQPLQQADDQRLRISVYGVRRPSDLSRRADAVRGTDGTGAGRLLPTSVPRTRQRTRVSVMNLPSASQQEGRRVLGAAPRLRPFGGIRAPQTEFLSFSDVSDIREERANPARHVAHRQRVLSTTATGRAQQSSTVRSGSMAYASARMALQAPHVARPSKKTSMGMGRTRLQRRMRRHKGLLPAPTSYVVASQDTSWLDESPVRVPGRQGISRDIVPPEQKSHLQWTKTVGRHGDSRPSTSTYIGTLRLAFGTGSQRAIEGDIPSWAERAAHGDLSTLGAARRQKTMQSASIQRLVNSQSVEQMLGVLAQHRRSLQEISEFLPGKAAKVLDQLVNLDPNAIQRSRRQEPDTLIQSDSAGRGNGRKTVQQTTLSGPRRSGPSGAGGGRASHLANQLLKLIHLAEVERRVDDAHKEVRMSQHEPGASSTAGGDADGAQKANAVRMRELYADVTQEVMLILEQNSKRENY